MAQFLKGKNQFHQEQYEPFDFVVEFPEAEDTPLSNVAISALARTVFQIVLFFVDSEGVWVMMPDSVGEYQMGYIAAMLTRSPLDQDLKVRERKFANDEIYYDFTAIPLETECKEYFRLKKLEPRRHE
jgi:hypothetical protein